MAEVYVARPRSYGMYFKIGMSDSPRDRLNQLGKHEHHRVLELMLVTDYGLSREEAFDMESQIHNDLYMYRVGREWFVAPFWRVLMAYERVRARVVHGHFDPPGWSQYPSDKAFMANLERLCGAEVLHG
jgi:hypothetical protein